MFGEFFGRNNEEISEDIAEDEPEAETLTRPTPENYPLHAAVLIRDVDALTTAIGNLPPIDNPLLPRRLHPINVLDHRGYSALHLAVFLSWMEGLDLLLENGASPRTRSKHGWTVMQECVSTSQRVILRELMAADIVLVGKSLRMRQPLIYSQLLQRPDFYVEIDWKFSSWIPFVSNFCPSDTFRIWKKGAMLRVDFSLRDFRNMAWVRKPTSFFIEIDSSGKPPNMCIVDHEARSVMKRSRREEVEEQRDRRQEFKEDPSLDDDIEYLMQTELVSPTMNTTDITIERAVNHSWLTSALSLGFLKNDEKWIVIGGKEPQADEKEGTDDENTGENDEDVEDESDDEPDEDDSDDDEDEGTRCAVYNLKNIRFTILRRNSHVPEEIRVQQADSNSVSDLNDVGEVPEEYRTEDDETNLDNNLLVEFAASAAEMEQPGDDTETPGDPSTEEPSQGSNSLLRIGPAKRYEYPVWEPPVVDPSDYFAHDEKSFEPPPASRDSVVLNPAPESVKSLNFKGMLAMSDSFGLTLDEVMAFLDIIAPSSKLAAKLREFLDMKMPPGFPVQLEIPLFRVLKATVTFQNFVDDVEIDGKIFELPADYEVVVKGPERAAS